MSTDCTSGARRRHVRNAITCALGTLGVTSRCAKSRFAFRARFDKKK